MPFQQIETWHCERTKSYSRVSLVTDYKKSDGVRRHAIERESLRGLASSASAIYDRALKDRHRLFLFKVNSERAKCLSEYIWS